MRSYFAVVDGMMDTRSLRRLCERRGITTGLFECRSPSQRRPAGYIGVDETLRPGASEFGILTYVGGGLTGDSGRYQTIRQKVERLFTEMLKHAMALCSGEVLGTCYTVALTWFWHDLGGSLHSNWLQVLSFSNRRIARAGAVQQHLTPRPSACHRPRSRKPCLMRLAGMI